MSTVQEKPNYLQVMQESYDQPMDTPNSRCSNKSQTKDCFQESYVDDWAFPKEE